MRKLILIVSFLSVFGSSSFSQSGADSSHYIKAFEYYDNGDYKSAAEHFSLSIKAGYKSMKSYMFRGVSEMLENELGKARVDFSTAFRMNPSNSDINFYIGRLYFVENKYDSAILYCDKAILLDSSDADYYDCLAMSYLGLQKVSLALKKEDNAISLSPSNTIYINNRGIIKQTMGMYQEAIDDFKKSLQLNPSGNTEYINIAFCLYKLKEYKEALEICNQVIHNNQQLPYALFVRGQLYYDMGDTEKACLDFRQLSLQKGEYGAKGAVYLKKYCH